MQEAVFLPRVADLLNLEVDLLFFDTTSTYCETETADEFRRHGKSKDSRPATPPWEPLSAWWITSAGWPVRASAIVNADTTGAASWRPEVSQPTIPRWNRSRIAAR